MCVRYFCVKIICLLVLLCPLLRAGGLSSPAEKLSPPSKAADWSYHGHRIIGYITWHFLSPQARLRLTQLLGGEKDFVQAQTYADKIRKHAQYSYTSPWHYTTIPQGTTQPSQGQDVLKGIKRFHNHLTTKQYHQNQLFDLKLFMHFVGDVHQPLHVGNGLDRGGNQQQVHFFDEPMSLHVLWDSQVLYTWMNNPAKAAQAIISTHSATPVAQRKCIDWAHEVLPLRQAAYQAMPHNSASSAAYYQKHLPVMQLQLYRAGKRLAQLLNDLYSY